MTKTNSTNKPYRLSDTQLVILSAASQNAFGSALPLPNSIKAAPKTIRNSIKRLIENGLLKEVPANGDQPVWRVVGDKRFAVVITTEGIAAIGLDTTSEPSGAGPSRATKTATKASKPAAAKTRASRAAGNPPKSRSGRTKLGTIAKLIGHKKGASISKLAEATGWQPHSVRAALTGLRKRGMAIERSRSRGGQSIYTADVSPRS